MEETKKYEGRTALEWLEVLDGDDLSSVSKELAAFIIENGKDLRTTPEEDLKHTEDKIQADCYMHFHETYPHLRGLLYHVPNGEKRDKITANLLKAKGVVPGIPDLVFHYKNNTYFFELKKHKTSTVSLSQEKIHKQLDLQGFHVWLVNDLDTFKYLIDKIINDGSIRSTSGLRKDDFLFKVKLFNYLYALEDGVVIKIDDVCGDENFDRFMHFLSEFTVQGYDTLDGFRLLFTPCYQGFYKKTKVDQKIIK